MANKNNNNKKNKTKKVANKIENGTDTLHSSQYGLDSTQKSYPA